MYGQRNLEENPLKQSVITVPIGGLALFSRHSNDRVQVQSIQEPALESLTLKKLDKPSKSKEIVFPIAVHYKALQFLICTLVFLHFHR